jgi:hypothetical protein
MNVINKIFSRICFTDQSDFTQLLDCSHEFCNGCWSLYIASCIKSGQSNIACPHFKCKTIITEPLIWSCTNSKLYQQYRKIHLENLISTNPQLQYCPAADCPRLAYVEDVESVDDKQPDSIPVLCECGLVWCFSCQNQAHWPASCKEMDAFCKAFENYEGYIKLLRHPGLISSVHVKRCPVCCHPIEKGMFCCYFYCSWL